MNDFIEAMIQGHDYTKYKWISGKCAEKCYVCESNNNDVKTMQRWQAEGLPQVVTKTNFHECGDECSCKLEKADY